MSGTVTVEGQPLETGIINFFPVDQTGERAFGRITNGAYTLSTSDTNGGARPGKYEVTVSASKTASDGPVAKNLQEEMQGIGANTKSWTEYLAHRKYSIRTMSELTATVEDATENKVDFDLEGPR